MNGMNGNEANDRVGRLIADCANKFSLPVGGVALVSLLTACAPQPPLPPPEEEARCELPNFDAGRKYVAEAWAIPDSRFDVGEQLQMQMRASAPSHMSIFYVSTSCKVTRLLDNHAVQAAEIVDFPITASGLQMTVKPPAGDEVFYFVATRDPLDFLSSADILGEVAGVANFDLSPAQFYKRLADARSRINPDDWSVKTLRTSVVGH